MNTTTPNQLNKVTWFLGWGLILIIAAGFVSHHDAYSNLPPLMLNYWKGLAGSLFFLGFLSIISAGFAKANQED